MPTAAARMNIDNESAQWFNGEMSPSISFSTTGIDANALHSIRAMKQAKSEMTTHSAKMPKRSCWRVAPSTRRVFILWTRIGLWTIVKFRKWLIARMISNRQARARTINMAL